jgi:hypothetical protein
MLTAIGRFLFMPTSPSCTCGSTRSQAEDGKPLVRKLRISFPDPLPEYPNGVANGLTQKFVFVLHQHVWGERIQFRISGIVQPPSLNHFAVFVIHKKHGEHHRGPTIWPSCAFGPNEPWMLRVHQNTGEMSSSGLECKWLVLKVAFSSKRFDQRVACLPGQIENIG